MMMMSFILFVIPTSFRPLCPSAFFKCLLHAMAIEYDRQLKKAGRYNSRNGVGIERQGEDTHQSSKG